MAYLLDTDTLSNALRGQASIRKQILATPAQDIWISVISVEEILRGRLDLIRKRQKSSEGISAAYGALLSSLADISQMNVLPYDSEAQLVYAGLDAGVIRLGAQDCRIAATAISRGLVVVTGNLRHFQKIPDLTCTDWSYASDDMQSGEGGQV